MFAGMKAYYINQRKSSNHIKKGVLTQRPRNIFSNIFWQHFAQIGYIDIKIAITIVFLLLFV